MIFARVGRVMCWCGSMMIMESFGTSASNAIGGISTTIAKSLLPKDLGTGRRGIFAVSPYVPTTYDS